jgi:WD40 repeat protein
MKNIVLAFTCMFVLAACTSTPKIHLVDSMGIAMELTKPVRVPRTVDISPDGRYGLSGGFDKTIMLWDLLEGKETNLLTGHTGWITHAEFSQDGKYVISGAVSDKAVRLWDTSSGKEIKQLLGHKVGSLLGVVVLSVALSPDGSKAASGGQMDGVRLWDIKTGSEIMTPLQAGINWGGRNTVFSSDGRYILTGETGLPGSGHRATLWDATSGKKIRVFNSKRPNWEVTRAVSAVDVSPDGKYVLTGSLNGFITIWDFESGEETRAWEAHLGLNGVTSARFSPDGKYILSAGPDMYSKLWEASTGKEIRQFVTGQSRVLTAVAHNAVFSPDGRYVLSGGSDAALRLWDVATGEEMAMMVGFEDGEWIFITRGGYYNASEKGAQYLTVKADDKDYTVNQFYDVFYRPDIVAAKLRGEDISGLVSITMQDAIKSPPPVVEFTSKLGDTDQPKVKVCYQVKSTGGGIGEVRLFHNGKLIQSDGYYKEMSRSGSDKTQLASLNSNAIYEDMRGVSIKGKVETTPIVSKSKGEVFENCRDVEAIPGENEVSVTAFNSGNTVQGYMKTVSFNSKLKAEETHLYILAIGIDQYKDSNVNLKYAVKDARDIEEKIKVQAATLYSPRNIHYELLTDREATKANITNKIDALAKTMKPQDSFIFFVAGHGVLLQNQYYLLTHDYNGNISENSVISSNEIVDMSKKIKSLSQLFIFDTCHAGGVDTIISGLYDARMSVLAKKMGLHIYASASDKQAAMDGYKGNGLFTYTLLDGLNNNRQADKNRDGKVSIVGLGEYSKKRTIEISKEIGHSQTPLIINFGKDSPIYRLQ